MTPPHHGRWPSFAAYVISFFVIGIVLFSTLALLPPYLSQLMHYPVLNIGLLLAPRGIGTMIGMMVVGRLLGRIDARWPIAVGIVQPSKSEPRPTRSISAS